MWHSSSAKLTLNPIRVGSVQLLLDNFETHRVCDSNKQITLPLILSNRLFTTQILGGFWVVTWPAATRVFLSIITMGGREKRAWEYGWYWWWLKFFFSQYCFWSFQWPSAVTEKKNTWKKPAVETYLKVIRNFYSGLIGQALKTIQTEILSVWPSFVHIIPVWGSPLKGLDRVMWIQWSMYITVPGRVFFVLCDCPGEGSSEKNCC